MNTVGDDPEGQLDPEDYADDGDLWIDEGIPADRLPGGISVRRPAPTIGESLRQVIECDGLEECPELLRFTDPLFDGDW